MLSFRIKVAVKPENQNSASSKFLQWSDQWYEVVGNIKIGGKLSSENIVESQSWIKFGDQSEQVSWNSQSLWITESFWLLLCE